MVVLAAEFTAAQLTLGLDIMDMEPFVNHKMSKRVRKVKSILITGSAAVDDFKCDLYYGQRLQASNLYNVSTGLANITQKTIPIVGGDMCHQDEPIKLVITDAADTNPVYIKLCIS